MADIKKPARKRKGPPPPEEQTRSNLTKPSSNQKVALNFQVPAEFHKGMKQYAAELGITMTDLIIEAVGEYRSRRE